MKFDKLRVMYVERETTQNKVFTACNITGHQIMALAYNNGNLSMATIDKLCTYLKCQPCDIMELDDD